MTSSFYSKTAILATMFFVAFLFYGCSDFLHPVESTPTPTEYQFNYWLLQKTYLFEDELPGLDPDGESVETLYGQLKDPYTRYYPPSKSENASISINTSIAPGDVGMEYYLVLNTTHPLFVSRVYPNSPASKAGVPRYGNIIEINGIDLVTQETNPDVQSVYSKYNSELTRSKEVSLTVVNGQDTLYFTMTKEDVYAPTVFIDTVDGIPVISLTAFKPTTIDQSNGSLGELKAYLDSTQEDTKPRVINLLNNPGGHVNQCVAMADLFVSKGPLSTKSWFSFNGWGEREKHSSTVDAKAGDAGEGRPFVLLINGSSASCAEIFTAAVAEGANIPVVGQTSFGKGIGQTTWNTIDSGLAVITNLEFLTPKGNSYHRKGIVPDYTCDVKASLQCGVDWAKKIYGYETDLKKKASNLIEIESIRRTQDTIGGAYIDGISL